MHDVNEVELQLPLTAMKGVEEIQTEVPSPIQIPTRIPSQITVPDREPWILSCGINFSFSSIKAASQRLEKVKTFPEIVNPFFNLQLRF